eukprot:jgi/Mesvir1/7905/Mv11836-RA.1
MCLATLPCRMGGCGLTRAARLAPAAFLGSVAQAWAEIRRLVPSAVSAIPDLVTPSPFPFVQAVQDSYLGIQQACDLVRPAQAVHRRLPRGTPGVSTVVSPSVFPACVHEKQQKTYAGILHCADWMGLHASLNDQGKAWLHSVSLEGSVGSAFLRALPMSPLFTLVPALYAIALRHQLFAPQPLITAGASCGSCGLALDTTGTHYIACMGGQQNQNWFLYLHTALLRVVCAMVRSVFPHSTIKCEDADGAALYSPNHRRPDITVLDYDGQGCHLLIDVSVARPLSGRHILRAAVDAGAAAAVAERDKFASYGNVGPHRVIPFVLEEFGAMGPKTAEFFHECCQRREDRLDLEGQTAPWSARTWSSYWRQRLSLALTRTVADVLFRRTRADFVATHAV